MDEWMDGWTTQIVSHSIISVVDILVTLEYNKTRPTLICGVAGVALAAVAVALVLVLGVLACCAALARPFRSRRFVCAPRLFQCTWLGILGILDFCRGA